MSVFTYSQIIKDNKLYIPPEYRAIFGWYNGLEIFVTSLNPNGDETKHSNELILTPIDPKNRLDVWRLQLSFLDRKGLLRDLTLILKDLGIDIISSKVHSSDQGKYVHVDMMIDNQLYRGLFDKDTVLRKKNKIVYLDELKNLIVSRFINEIVFVTSNTSLPMAKIKRCLPLYRSYEYIDEYGHDSIKDGCINLPKHIIETIQDRYKEKYPHVGSTKRKEGLPRVSLVAEFESHLIRGFVYFKDTDVIHLRIKAKNQVGAVAKMCEIINSCGFNISQMNNRVLENGLLALSDFLLGYIPGEKESMLKDSQLQRRLKAAFNNSDSEFGMEVSFPKTKQYINGEYK